MSKVLIVAEHLNGRLNLSATAKTVSAARAFSPAQIDVLVLSDAPAAIAADTRVGETAWLLARQEFLVAAGNPKAILIFTAFLPQFVVPEHYAVSYTEVGATFLLLEIVTVGIYGGVGRYMAHMANRGRMMQWLNRASGTMMIAFGILLALVRRPQAA